MPIYQANTAGFDGKPAVSMLFLENEPAVVDFFIGLWYIESRIFSCEKGAYDHVL